MFICVSVCSLVGICVLFIIQYNYDYRFIVHVIGFFRKGGSWDLVVGGEYFCEKGVELTNTLTVIVQLFCTLNPII